MQIGTCSIDCTQQSGSQSPELTPFSLRPRLPLPHHMSTCSSYLRPAPSTIPYATNCRPYSHTTFRKPPSQHPSDVHLLFSSRRESQPIPPSLRHQPAGILPARQPNAGNDWSRSPSTATRTLMPRLASPALRSSRSTSIMGSLNRRQDRSGRRAWSDA